MLNCFLILECLNKKTTVTVANSGPVIMIICNYRPTGYKCSFLLKNWILYKRRLRVRYKNSRFVLVIQWKGNRILIQKFIVCAIYLTMCENYLTRQKVFYLACVNVNWFSNGKCAWHYSVFSRDDFSLCLFTFKRKCAIKVQVNNYEIVVNFFSYQP